jgi:DNA end-binding protein Ku
MKARSTWKGSLKFSLISIPIRVTPATSSSSDISFRQLHRKCLTPIQLKKWCPREDVEVSNDDVVKGYESSKGRFVVVEEEEIKALRPESTRTIDISDVVDATTIDPIYIERAYYIAPDSKTAGAAFAVVRDALTDKAGIGRLALHGREYLVAVVRRDNALLCYTLRTVGEVRALDQVDGLEFADARVKPEELKLAKQVLEGFDTGRDLSSYTDHYQEALKAMLKKKGAGEAINVEGTGKSGQVVDLMDALRKSLATVHDRKGARGHAKTAKVLPHASGKRARKAS